MTLFFFYCTLHEARGWKSKRAFTVLCCALRLLYNNFNCLGHSDLNKRNEMIIGVFCQVIVNVGTQQRPDLQYVTWATTNELKIYTICRVIKNKPPTFINS